MKGFKIIPLFTIALLLFLSPVRLSSDNLTITQIDSSLLLLNQRVDLYISVTDGEGDPLKGLSSDQFRVYESPNNKTYTEVTDTVRFEPEVNRFDGINFLLLLDNSGSMYDTLQGTPTDQPEEMRITHAKSAVLSFIESVTNPKDTLGVATFNTNYSSHSARIQDRIDGEQVLDQIKRPTKDEAYTELYGALLLASNAMETRGGRNVIIVLSDGENFPYHTHSGKQHPVFKDRIIQHTEPIESFQREGITLFAINFGREKDRHLNAIALDTGGTVFDAQNASGLADVYHKIRDRVLGEYRLSYKATMDPAERRYVKVEYSSDGRTGSRKAATTRFYFSGMIFGLPMDRLYLWLLFPFLIGIVLLGLLSKVKFERPVNRAGLEVLRKSRGTLRAGTIALDKGRTIIGSSQKADLTIAGVPEIEESHATVLFDRRKKLYTIVSGEAISVNNKPVKKKDLESGDVINVGGTVIVFDEESAENEKHVD